VAAYAVDAYAWYAVAFALGEDEARRDLESLVLRMNPEELARARERVIAAAEKGDSKAQYHAGLLLEKGDGMRADIGRAVKMYREAADAGLLSAQLKLGYLFYFGGETLKAEPKEAVHWFKAAAERGHPVAQFYLADLYEKTPPPVKDNVEAYRWLAIAGEQGLDDARHALLALVPHMRDEDIAEGKRRALQKP
jgi:TPR repeat protein